MLSWELILAGFLTVPIVWVLSYVQMMGWMKAQSDKYNKSLQTVKNHLKDEQEKKKKA